MSAMTTTDATVRRVLNQRASAFTGALQRGVVVALSSARWAPGRGCRSTRLAPSQYEDDRRVVVGLTLGVRPSRDLRRSPGGAAHDCGPTVENVRCGACGCRRSGHSRSPRSGPRCNRHRAGHRRRRCSGTGHERGLRERDGRAGAHALAPLLFTARTCRVWLPTGRLARLYEVEVPTFTQPPLL